MSTPPIDPSPRPGKATSPRKTYAIGGVLTVLAAGGAVAWYAAAHRVPPPDGRATDVVRFVADDHFKDMTYDQKNAYVARLEAMPLDQRRKLAQDAGLTPEQGRAAYKNIYDQAVRMRINKYFTFKTDAERNAYLDHLIDEWKREQTFTKPEGGTGKVQADPGAVKKRLETVPPGDRARAATFIQAFLQRSLAKGLGLAK